MSGKDRYFRLGVFVLTATALLIAGVLALGVGSMFKHYIHAETYFEEPVEGLDVGAPVKYRGVKIGRVSSIGFVGEVYQQAAATQPAKVGAMVMVETDIDPDAPPARDVTELREEVAKMAEAGLRVRLASSLTGPSYLEVDYLDPKAYPAVQIPWKPRHLYVPSAPNSTRRIVSAVERIAVQLEQAKLDQVVKHVDDLIGDASKAVRDLNTAQLSGDASQALRDIRGTIDHVNKVVQNPNIDEMLANLNAASGGVKDAVGGKDGNLQVITQNVKTASEQLRQAVDRINQIARDPRLDEALAGLKTTTQNSGPAMADLRQMLRKLNLVVATESRDMEAIIQNLRELSDSAAALAQDAKQNPSRVLFGEPPPRVKIGDKR